MAEKNVGNCKCVVKLKSLQFLRFIFNKRYCLIRNCIKSNLVGAAANLCSKIELTQSLVLLCKGM